MNGKLGTPEDNIALSIYIKNSVCGGGRFVFDFYINLQFSYGINETLHTCPKQEKGGCLNENLNNST